MFEAEAEQMDWRSDVPSALRVVNVPIGSLNHWLYEAIFGGYVR